MLRAYADGSLFGEAHGDGEPRVLWLHGWARRGRDFDGAAQVLADRGVASVALDLPGFGATPAPERAGGAREYARAVAPVLGEIATSPVVLVGHSLGGRVATVLAATNPDRVAGLVIVAAPLVRLGAAAPPPAAYRAVRWLARRGVVSDARLEAARQRYGSADYRAAKGVMRDVLVTMIGEDYSDELARVSAPASLVWGERDAEVPVAVARRVIEILGGRAPLAVLAGVGHLVPTEAPLALADAAWSML
ncbi:MAG: alpha/beta fold hydrolase [Acidimicrobiales bacterium]